MKRLSKTVAIVASAVVVATLIGSLIDPEFAAGTGRAIGTISVIIAFVAALASIERSPGQAV